MNTVLTDSPASVRRPTARRAALALLLDVGPATGLGHWHRCLALAAALREQWSVTLITPPLPPALRAELAVRDEQVGETAGWSPEAVFAAMAGCCPCPAVFVLDLISTPVDLVAALRRVAPVASIGGAGPGRDDVDLRIDGMIPRPGFSDRFRGGQLLVGPEYVMLRDEFVPDLGPVSERIERVLVALGGDAEGRGLRLAEQLAKDCPGFEFDVVLGPLAAPATSLPGVRTHVNPFSLARLMSTSQVAVCSGGMTAYELCRVGVPMVLHPQTPLQLAAARGFVARGLAELATTTAEVVMALNRLSPPSVRRAIRRSQHALLTGGGVGRVADALNASFLPAA